jgi:LuxR family transcriptional regulator, maltose regulon positive regulatory protein
MLAHGEATLLLSWMEALPEELLRSRPWLCIPYAWALLIYGRLEAAELRVRDLESLVDAAGEILTSDDELAAVSGEAAAIRAYIVRNRGDVLLSIELSRRALGLFPEDNFTLRGIVAYLLGVPTR